MFKAWDYYGREAHNTPHPHYTPRHIDYQLESEASNVPGVQFLMAKRSVSEVFGWVNGYTFNFPHFCQRRKEKKRKKNEMAKDEEVLSDTCVKTGGFFALLRKLYGNKWRLWQGDYRLFSLSGVGFCHLQVHQLMSSSDREASVTLTSAGMAWCSDGRSSGKRLKKTL